MSFMNKKILYGTACVLTLVIACLMSYNRVSAAQKGDTFTDENGWITYTITSVGNQNTCAVTAWKNTYVSDEDPEFKKMIIPETVLYENTEFTVTEINPKYSVMSININEIEIPSTVTNINIKQFGFGLSGYDSNYDANDIKNGIKFVFKCAPGAFSKISRFTVVNEAISSIIYVPEEYLDEYRALLADKTHFIIRDNEREPRTYGSLPIVKIGDENVLPLGFIYKDSYYKILNSDKKTVSLIKKTKVTNKDLNGSIYKQPGKVFYKDMKFTVVKIEYFAFCDAMWPVFYGIKLPKTITSIDSKSIGWQITSLDLSETKIKTIPANLVNQCYDEFDEKPYLTEIILPKNCKTIKKKALYNCKLLKNVSIPAKTKYVGKKAFPSKCIIYYE